MIFGISYLAGVKYQDLVLKNHPKGFVACFFAEIFGDAYSFVYKFLAKHSLNCPLLEMQLIWDDNHSYGDKNIPKITSLARKYNTLAHDFPETIIELSTFCEHRLRSPDKYLEITKDYAPLCRVVNTPDRGGLNSGAFSREYKNEFHGGGNPPTFGKYNFDFDGSSCFDANIHECLEDYSKAEVFKLWTWQFNQRMNIHDKTDREDRIVKPNVKHIRACQAVVRFPRNHSLPEHWTWKSNCEQTKEINDTRADKPVLITPVKASKAVIRDFPNKKLICEMPNSGKYTDGRYKYYAPIWGYQMEEKSLTSSNSEFVTLTLGTHEYRIRPALRNREFR